MSFRPVSSIFGIIASAVLLVGCTNTAVTVDYFAKNILSTYTFKVNNAVNENEIYPNATHIPFDVSCSGAISRIEVQDLATQEWKSVSDVDTGAQINCSQSGSASFSLPISHVNAILNPTGQGTKRYSFPLRIVVPNITGELSSYDENYTAVFSASALTINASNINAATAVSSYVVSGTCSMNGEQISVETGSSSGTGVCTSGAYSIALNLTTITDGVNWVRVTSTPGASYYAFAAESKNITVDRVAPSLTISSPSASATINAAGLNANGGVTVQGTCEAGLPVVLTATNGVGITTSCISGTFSASLGLVAQGSMLFRATQTDVVGNVGTTADRSVTIGTTLPTTFAISGVRSVDSGDILVDNSLTALGLQVHFARPTGVGLLFDIEVFDEDNVFAVGKYDESLTGTNVSVNFGSFVGVNGSQYTVKVKATDIYGNTRVATNNGFTFTVNYPEPKITSVTISNPGPLGNTTIGTAIKFYVEFDQEITVTNAGTGLLKPRLVLQLDGETIYFDHARMLNVKTLEFDYTIEAGRYANPIKLVTGGTLDGGVIKSSTTNVLASRAFPSTSISPATVLDTKNPAFPSMNLAPTASPYMDRTPIVNFTLASDPGTVQMYAKVARKSDDVVMKSDVAVTSGTRITGVSSMDPGTQYRVYYYAKDSYGNATATQYVDFTSFSCPTGYLYMDTSDAHNAPFCVGFTEAKEDGLGKPVHQLSLAPKSYVSRDEAEVACRGLTPSGDSGQYDLISNSQWNAVAAVIANNSANWTNGTVGGGSGGSIPTGHTNPSNTFVGGAEINAGNPCGAGAGWNDLCGSYPLRKRNLKLSRNQDIWDFSGNLHELVKDKDANFHSAANALAEFFQKLAPASTVFVRYSSNMPVCAPYASNSASCGYGMFYTICSEKQGATGATDGNCANGTYTNLSSIGLTTVVRGGGVGPLQNSGILGTLRYMYSNQNNTFNVGFRCVYNPAL